MTETGYGRGSLFSGLSRDSGSAGAELHHADAVRMRENTIQADKESSHAPIFPFYPRRRPGPTPGGSVAPGRGSGGLAVVQRTRAAPRPPGSIVEKLGHGHGPGPRSPGPPSGPPRRPASGGRRGSLHPSGTHLRRAGNSGAGQRLHGRTLFPSSGTASSVRQNAPESCRTHPRGPAAPRSPSAPAGRTEPRSLVARGPLLRSLSALFRRAFRPRQRLPETPHPPQA